MSSTTDITKAYDSTLPSNHELSNSRHYLVENGQLHITGFTNAERVFAAFNHWCQQSGSTLDSDRKVKAYIGLDLPMPPYSVTPQTRIPVGASSQIFSVSDQVKIFIGAIAGIRDGKEPETTTDALRIGEKIYSGYLDVTPASRVADSESQGALVNRERSK